jgi:diguanylate cyclase (GGDEF)-like protein
MEIKDRGMLDQLGTTDVQGFLNNLPAPLVLLDQVGKLAWCNDGFAQLVAEPAVSLTGKLRTQLPVAVQALLRDGQMEFNIQGLVMHLSCIPVSMGTHTLYYCNDISLLQQLLQERTALLQQVAELAPTDPATGLLNPRTLQAHLEQEAARSRRYGNTMSVMLLRLNNLAQYRQAVGDAADALLLAIGQSLKDQMRWADVIGHMSENEFLLIMPETADQAAADLCGKILDQIGRIELADPNFELRIDFGMTQWRKGDDVNLFMQRARQELEAGTPSKLAM